MLCMDGWMYHGSRKKERREKKEGGDKYSFSSVGQTNVKGSKKKTPGEYVVVSTVIQRNKKQEGEEEVRPPSPNALRTSTYTVINH